MVEWQYFMVCVKIILILLIEKDHFYIKFGGWKFGTFILRDFEYVEPISAVNWSFKEFVLCCELIPNALFPPSSRLNVLNQNAD